jgi:hypothetical protein
MNQCWKSSVTSAAIVFWGLAAGSALAVDLDWIRVAGDQRSFVHESSGRPFVPWGFNYDHDATEAGRLIEDYWFEEWDKVEADFGEMKMLGANVVRIHLQFGRFMTAADQPSAKQLDQLGRLLQLAERTGLYLDLTGLGCYHKQDVPAWYDRLDEPSRWQAQAKFWEAVAERCQASPAVFCYDLMNEPIVPGGQGQQDDWLGPAFGGKHFVQCITRDAKNRPRPEIARQWIERLVKAVRIHDRRHLVTVGLVPWSLDRAGLSSGFVPEKVTGDLDFIAVHIYPRAGKLAESLDTLKGFAVGKPIVVEETFPLTCSAEELSVFIDQSRGVATGWIGFYWGKTPDEYRGSDKLGDVATLHWLELFRKKSAAMVGE